MTRGSAEQSTGASSRFHPKFLSPATAAAEDYVPAELGAPKPGLFTVGGFQGGEVIIEGNRNIRSFDYFLQTSTGPSPGSCTGHLFAKTCKWVERRAGGYRAWSDHGLLCPAFS